jgi:hypothetical protein
VGQPRLRLSAGHGAVPHRSVTGGTFAEGGGNITSTRHPRVVKVVMATMVMTLFAGTTLAVALATGGVASANPTWSSPTAIDGGNVFQSVSCVSATFCAAVDFSGNAFTYHGSSWSSPVDLDGDNSPYGLSAVSCVSTTFCAAVDLSGNAFTYNGSSWSSQNNIDGGNLFTSVSCTSPTFCAAVANSGNVLTYNGRRWFLTVIDGGLDLDSVSCSSASFCAAVDDAGNVLTYDGSSWSSPKDIDGSNLLLSVSCSFASFCAAVDLSGNALIYSGSTWSSAIDIDASHSLDSVSCVSPTFCTAVAASGNAFTYNGSSWSTPTPIDVGNTPVSVSCITASFCAAVDYDGNALIYSEPSGSGITCTEITGNVNFGQVHISHCTPKAGKKYKKASIDDYSNTQGNLGNLDWNGGAVTTVSGITQTDFGYGSGSVCPAGTFSHVVSTGTVTAASSSGTGIPAVGDTVRWQVCLSNTGILSLQFGSTVDL